MDKSMYIDKICIYCEFNAKCKNKNRIKVKKSKNLTIQKCKKYCINNETRKEIINNLKEYSMTEYYKKIKKERKL